MKQENVYNLAPEEVLKKFNSSLVGLSGGEVKARLKEFGPNKIAKNKTGNG